MIVPGIRDPGGSSSPVPGGGCAILQGHSGCGALCGSFSRALLRSHDCQAPGYRREPTRPHTSSQSVIVQVGQEKEEKEIHSLAVWTGSTVGATRRQGPQGGETERGHGGPVQRLSRAAAEESAGQTPVPREQREHWWSCPGQVLDSGRPPVVVVRVAVWTALCPLCGP